MADVGNMLAKYGSRGGLLSRIEDFKTKQVSNKINQFNLRKAQADEGRQNQLREAYPGAVAGDPAAMQQVAGLDPDMYNAMEKTRADLQVKKGQMDAQSRALAKEQFDEAGRKVQQVQQNPALMSELFPNIPPEKWDLYVAQVATGSEVFNDAQRAEIDAQRAEEQGRQEVTNVTHTEGKGSFGLRDGKMVQIPGAIIPDDRSPATGTITLVSPDGKNRRGFRVDNPEVDKLLAENWVKAPSQQETSEVAGGFGNQGASDKMLAEATEDSMTTINMLSGVDDVLDVISSPDYVGGVTGDMISLFNSGAAQYRQLTGITDITDKEFRDGAASRLRKAALQNGLEDSIVTHLEYVMAKLVDPGGRISNADVDNAVKFLGKTADVQIRKQILNKLKHRATKAHDRRQDFRRKRLRLGVGEIPNLGDARSTASGAAKEMSTQDALNILLKLDEGQ